MTVESRFYILSHSLLGGGPCYSRRTPGRASCVNFDNPDFVLYARSFGAEGYRIEKASDLLPTLRAATRKPGVTVIDCPVDYRENVFLTERLGALVCSD